VVASADIVAGQYCEDCQVAKVQNRQGLRDGVQPYALDADHARTLWAKSEELVGETF
jgi:hypothetical protein